MIIIILLLFGGALFVAAAWIFQRNWYFLQYAYFLRVPIILLLIAWALPASVATEVASITSNWFDLKPLGFIVVTWFSTILAWSIMVQAGMIWEGGAVRNRLAANKARNKLAEDHKCDPTNPLWRWVTDGEIPLIGNGLRQRMGLQRTVVVPFRLLVATAVGAGPILFTCVARSQTDGWTAVMIIFGFVGAYSTWLVFDLFRQRRKAARASSEDVADTEGTSQAVADSTGVKNRIASFLHDTYAYQQKYRMLFTFGNAFFFASSILVVAAVVGVLTFPGWWVQLDIDFPAIAYIFLFVTFLGWIAAFGTYLFDKYRIPVLTLMALVLIFTQQEHYFETRPLAESMTEVNGESRVGFASDTGDLSIVVAVNGGGITASYFTALALCELTSRYGEDFVKHLSFISAVSGGSVGAMFYLGAKAPHPCMPNDSGAAGADVLAKNPIVKAAGRSSLSEVGWGLVYADVFPLKPFRFYDRAWAQERRWLRELRRIGGDRNWLGEWRLDLAPFHFAFNTTLAESGEQMVISTYDFKHVIENKAQAQPSVPGGNKTYVREFSQLYPNHDIHVVSAARLSATFPYVTPLARPDFGDDTLMHGYPYHHADGGYFDNWGVSTAIEYIRSVTVDPGRLPSTDSAAKPKKQFLVIEIRASDPNAEEGRIKPVRAGFLAPVKTMLNVWSSSQVGRNARELDLLAKSLDEVVLCTEGIVLKQEAPLSWHLSEDQKTDIVDGFYSDANKIAIDRIGTYLEAGTNRECIKDA